MYSRSFPFTLTAVKLEQLGVRCNSVLEISNVCTYFWLRSKSSLSICILEICLMHSPQSWWHSWECAWLRRSLANTLNKLFLFLLFFFFRGAIHQLNNEYLNFASYSHSNLASTVSSALGLGAGDLKRACLANSFFFCRGGIHHLINEYLNFASYPHRSLASTIDSVLGFRARGSWFESPKGQIKSKQTACADGSALNFREEYADSNHWRDNWNRWNDVVAQLVVRWTYWERLQTQITKGTSQAIWNEGPATTEIATMQLRAYGG